MKIRLESVGPYTCLPLPGQAATRPEFSPGSEVEVVWDSTRAQMLVRPAENGRASAPVPNGLAGIVDEVLSQYAEAMRELAEL